MKREIALIGATDLEVRQSLDALMINLVMGCGCHGNALRDVETHVAGLTIEDHAELRIVLHRLLR
ncbi:MAG: hypothetical protein AB8B62_04665 [Roseobacter sp.]